MSRTILFLEDEQDFLDEMIEAREFLGIQKNDTVLRFSTSRAAIQYLEALAGCIDIAILDLVLNEKPPLAYTRIQRPDELEGIAIYQRYQRKIKHPIFLTSTANYRAAANTGFDFNQRPIQACLKANAYEASEEQRFPQNLILALQTAYALLDSDGESHNE